MADQLKGEKKRLLDMAGLGKFISSAPGVLWMRCGPIPSRRFMAAGREHGEY